MCTDDRAFDHPNELNIRICRRSCAALRVAVTLRTPRGERAKAVPSGSTVSLLPVLPTPGGGTANAWRSIVASMPKDAHLVAGRDLIVRADYGQIYIESSATDDDGWPDDSPYLAALDDAVDSGRFVGVRPGLIDLMTPGQWNWNTPVRIEIWSSEPPDDRHAWDHEVDAYLDVPDGWISFAASGGGTPERTDIPAGTYRVRVSGRGFTVLGHAGAEGDDSYRLRLWLTEQAADPELRKRWPGWDSYR
jgi:hypothetical protein